MKRLVSLVALILCFAMLMTGCAKTAEPATAPAEEVKTEEAAPAEEAAVVENTTPAEEAAPEAKQPRVGMILSGPITDVSWNGPQYDALLEIEKKGASIAYQENVAVADVAEALRTYCDEGFDAIFLGTNYYEETILPITAEYPEISFFITNGTTTKDNVHSFQVADEQQGFLMGVITALVSEAKNVGFVGGNEITPIINGQKGFAQGVAYVNNGAVVNSTLTGTNTDVTANKETAKAMIDAGVDAIAPMCDNGALGVVEAAQEGGIYAVASGIAQQTAAPEAVIIAVVKNNGLAIQAAYDSYINGTMGPDTLKFGAAEGAIYLSDWFEAAADIPEDIKTQVAQAYAELAAGNITITLD